MNKKNLLKIKFRELPHQVKAIKNLEAVFRGVKFLPPQWPVCNPSLHTALSCPQLRKNIKQIRDKDEIVPGEVACYPRSPLELDILMETGTGKTFTFIETMYKLNELHGLSKFIILVPSTPIRKGALKNIEITKEFFGDKYGRRTVKAYEYSSHTIDSYIHNTNKNISVLVMTYQSFNRMNNIINKRNLETNLFTKAQSYMDALAALKPVIIIDEPHRFAGEKTKIFLEKFEPQIILRYGATFLKDDYKNLIYVLDSVDAFKQKLVKQILIHRPERIGKSELAISYKGYTGRGEDRKAMIEHLEGTKSGNTELLSAGDNLGEKLEWSYLDSYIVEKIYRDKILFTNEEELFIGDTKDYSILAETKARIMLQQTIKSHFDREEKLFKQGIKTLSLIFIDSRKSYLRDDGTPGELCKAFSKLYKSQLKEKLKGKLEPRYRAYLKRSADDIEDIHEGYFAISKEVKDEKDDIDLILNKKEELLSNETDLRFIFSKWALREGWDNPNIFTICKLAPSNSTITKLQQVGRGLRLAVKQTPSGFDRVTEDNFSSQEFADINRLNVIIPEEEKQFVASIQKEIDSNNMHSQTNFISGEKLKKWGICPTGFDAHELFNILRKHKLVEFNEETKEGKIIQEGNLEEAIKYANEVYSKLDFNADKLRKLYDEHLDLDTVVGISGKEDTAKINPSNWRKFKILWGDINKQATYNFSVNEKELHENIVAAINDELDIPKIEYQMMVDKITGTAEPDLLTEKQELVGKVEIDYNFYSFKEFVRKLSDGTKLSFGSIVKILQSIDESKFDMLANDEANALQKIIDICHREIKKHILTSIKFTIRDGVRETISLSTDEKKDPKEIKVSVMGRKIYRIEDAGLKAKSITSDKIGYDSNFELGVIKESKTEKVEVFSKLPTINIPIPGINRKSGYNPDFAYVVNTKDKKIKYHFVIESKGYDNKSSLREPENFKIEVARKFFDALTATTKVPIGYETLYKEDNGIEGLFNAFENKLPKVARPTTSKKKTAPTKKKKTAKN